MCFILPHNTSTFSGFRVTEVRGPQRSVKWNVCFFFEFSTSYSLLGEGWRFGHQAFLCPPLTPLTWHFLDEQLLSLNSYDGNYCKWRISGDSWSIAVSFKDQGYLRDWKRLGLCCWGHLLQQGIAAGFHSVYNGKLHILEGLGGGWGHALLGF